MFGDTFGTKKLFWIQKGWYLEVENLAFFAKGLVHDFGKNFKFPHLVFPGSNCLKRLFSDQLGTKNPILE